MDVVKYLIFTDYILPLILIGVYITGLVLYVFISSIVHQVKVKKYEKTKSL